MEAGTQTEDSFIQWNNLTNTLVSGDVLDTGDESLNKIEICRVLEILFRWGKIQWTINVTNYRVHWKAERSVIEEEKKSE